jgi:hypothetical protein
MKYTEHILKKLEESLQNGDGRVRAVKKAGISYPTFMSWMKNKKIFDRMVKAEGIGNDQIKDICKRRIIEDKHWQSAAWWLERNFPDEFRNKHEHEHKGGLTIQLTKKETDV